LTRNGHKMAKRFSLKKSGLVEELRSGFEH
jgi:hypothetical protein